MDGVLGFLAHRRAQPVAVQRVGAAERPGDAEAAHGGAVGTRAGARALARAASAIERVYYPGSQSHPQHALAKRQQRAGGAIVSFDVRGGSAPPGASSTPRASSRSPRTSATPRRRSLIRPRPRTAASAPRRGAPRASARAAARRGRARVGRGIKADLARGLGRVARPDLERAESRSMQHDRLAAALVAAQIAAPLVPVTEHPALAVVAVDDGARAPGRCVWP